MDKSFVMVKIPAIIVILTALLGILATACSSDIQTEQITREDVQTDQSAKKLQTEQPTRDGQAVQSAKLETLTVDDVKGIVVETAMNLYQDGLMPEPREIHAEEACKLWDEHGTSKSSSYWGDKMSEAEDANLRDALPVLVVVRTLVTLNERYETSEPAITQYCDNVLRTQSKSNIDADIDLSHLPRPATKTKVIRVGGTICSPDATSALDRMRSCTVDYGESVQIEIEGNPSKVANRLTKQNYSTEVITRSCGPDLVPQQFDGWDYRVLERLRREADVLRQNEMDREAFSVRIDLVNALNSGHVNGSDIREYCASALSK